MGQIEARARGLGPTSVARPAPIRAASRGRAGRGLAAVRVVALLLAAAAWTPAPASALPTPVASETVSLVFAGRDTLGDPVVASFSLAVGTGPTGATARRYRGWLARGPSGETLFDRKWNDGAPQDRGLASAFPSAAGVSLQGRTEAAGAFQRPVSIAVAWSEESRAISLSAEDLRAAVRRPSGEQPSDLYAAADPATFVWMQGEARATLTIGFERIEGRVFHEFVACEGASPFLGLVEAGGHFGDYDRALLWDDEGTFWLVESSRGTARAEEIPAGAARKPVRSKQATLTRLAMEAFPHARRQVPRAWRVEVPAWSFAASMRAISRRIDVGDVESRGLRTVHAFFSVAGEATVKAQPRSVFGAVEHVQD